MPSRGHFIWRSFMLPESMYDNLHRLDSRKHVQGVLIRNGIPLFVYSVNHNANANL
jgi:hypothetical protein